MDIYSYIEEAMRKFPDKVAISETDRVLTYSELENMVARISYEIVHNNIKSGDIVILRMDNSIEMIASMLSILRVGAICLPVNISIPIRRLLEIISSCNAKAIMDDVEEREYSVTHICINKKIYDKMQKLEDLQVMQPQNNYKNAFCIFTSGSTGKSKGVLITHAGVLNHANEKIRLLDISSNDICCLSLNIGFVAAIWQVLAPLMRGAKLKLYSNETCNNIIQFLSKVDKDKVNILEITPSALSIFLEWIASGKEKYTFTFLRTLVLTGERLNANLVEDFSRLYAIQLINAYGQSECSDDTFHYIIKRDKNYSNIPIGQPIQGISYYILNEELNKVPVGEIGELWISGIAVGEGYINDEELTAYKFSKNPFNTDEKIFRTGDLVRKNPEGDVEYIGRVDRQIKLRGYRISVEEVELAVCTYDGILEAVVLLEQNNAQNEYLHCYYKSIHQVDIEKLKVYLAELLPNYMIPVVYTKVIAFNYNANGKIERNCIDNIEKTHTMSEGKALVDEVTELLISEIGVEPTQQVTLNTKIVDLGINSSMDYIKMIVALEDKYDIVYNYDDDEMLMKTLVTIEDIIGSINKRTEVK